ncbi:pyridoxamine 5'-phosphate oxidase family protein [Ferranicluibacter rubi]|uniref:Pyridoxamine 5'-phosphate oxidase family protein n=1 Tax=Ferranicluibacter rubi TaxID=2715133 RepID=A0AA43ZBG4_9HYPH|nr:pyridoxamine 5'-phosphate oxidase family protein [Ferranicluibacter rubi]NHT74489.1 pyridoxamine 5'-phosphate oxidase family protein [Ferranicluibacter rubi]TCQ29445.1 general stress protein 26 [Rhizobium sp. PP-CC-3G-465]
MTNKTLADLAEKMREIDICMLSTHTDGGAIAGRPMSNNRNVDYDGSSYYFTLDDTRMVDDIKADSKVALAFQGTKAFLVAVEGKADLIRDRQAFREHWSADIDKWFADGIDTEGLVMIKVVAERAHYWDGEDEGEVTLKA